MVADTVRVCIRFFSGHPLSRLLDGCNPDRFLFSTIEAGTMPGISIFPLSAFRLI